MSDDVTTGMGEASGRDATAASRRLLEEGFSHGNLALADELLAPHAVNHDPAVPRDLQQMRGPEQFKRVVSMYRQAFPDVRLTVDDTIAQADKVVLRWHAEGTHRGKLQGLAPTGVRGSVTGIAIYRWEGGKVVEAWSEWDNLGLARQVGAAPAEGSLGERIGTGIQQLLARRMRKRAPA